MTWGELKARHPALEDYVRSRLQIRSAAGPCTLRPEEHLVDQHTDGTYAVLRFRAACAAPGEPLEIRYDLLFDLDPTHRGLLTVVRAGTTLTTAVLSPDRPSVRIDAARPEGVALLAFFMRGVEHLLFGFDHVLFLIVLLLPAAHQRRAGQWHPVARWPSAALDLVKVLSAFTVAHGLSLALATAGLVDLPDRLVESLIALTIGFAALDNLWPWLPPQRWRIAFGFGLVHGLGFAAALGPLDLPVAEFVLALVGFNLGIEAGQLVIALPVLAATFPVRQSPLYLRGLLPLGSAAALVIALIWFIERVFALRLLAI